MLAKAALRQRASDIAHPLHNGLRPNREIHGSSDIRHKKDFCTGRLMHRSAFAVTAFFSQLQTFVCLM
jgi:hypothetical protein